MASAWPVRLAACAAILLASVGIASAQEIEPNEYVPAPDGTNVSLSYFVFQHFGTFKTTSGTTVPDSSVNLYLGIERLAFFRYLFGHPAGFQVIQGFGGVSDAKLGGEPIGTTNGATNTVLSAFFWPYANFEQKQYLTVAGFLMPPNGSYDKNSVINTATLYQLRGQYNWTGDIQIGWDQGIGDHFSYDAGFDARFFGNTTGPVSPGSNIPISVTTHHNPDFRVQVFANWAWSRALTTAIGYQGFFAGDDWFNNPNPIIGGHVNVGKSYLQQLRGVAALFLSPRFQALLEVNGMVARTGGYKETVGTTLRFLYLF